MSDQLLGVGLPSFEEQIEAGRQYQRERDAARWQPIETAPRGRTRVLVYRPMAHVDKIAVRAVDDWCGPKCCPSSEPTHWMPLPEPPK